MPEEGKIYSKEELDAAIEEAVKSRDEEWKAKLQSESDRRVTEALNKRDKDWEVKIKEEKDKSAEQATKLQDTETQLRTINSQLSFTRRALREGLIDPEGGYSIAKDHGYIDDAGEVDWDKMKQERNYLFTSKATTGTRTGGGNRTSPSDGDGSPDAKMNKMIRRHSGRTE